MPTLAAQEDVVGSQGAVEGEPEHERGAVDDIERSEKPRAIAPAGHAYEWKERRYIPLTAESTNCL